MLTHSRDYSFGRLDALLLVVAHGCERLRLDGVAGFLSTNLGPVIYTTLPLLQVQSYTTGTVSDTLC